MSWLISRALLEACANSPCSPAAVAEFSAATCSGGEPSAPSSGTPMPQAFCSPDKMTEFSRLSRSGMTFAPLTADLGEVVWTWFLAGFPARTSVSPGVGLESMASAAGYGPKWPGSLARFDPDTRSWRTAQPCLLGDSDECSVIWPRSGMTAAGRCWELPMSAHRTSVTGSGLWPTPRTTGLDGGSNSRKAEKARGYWPTLTATLGTKGGRITRRKGREGGTLIEAISNRAAFPTPDAHCWKSGPRGNGTGGGEMLSNTVVVDGEEDRIGTLSPAWVEWLMGWPIGWTSLDALDKREVEYWRASNNGGGNGPHEAEAWFDEEAGAPGQDGSRPPISRTSVGVPDRVSRIKALGNGQVPRAAAAAWRLLTGANDV